MDLDSAYIEPMVLDWVEDFQEAVKDQEKLVNAKDEFYMPFVAIPTSVIKCIFKLSEHFELTAEAKYMSIHLYDKYVCNHFWEAYKEHLKSEHSEKSWQRTCRKISSNSKFYLMLCLQLASKMVSHSMSLYAPNIREALRLMDDKVKYTKDLAFSSEFEVFKMVGFMMPRYTPYHCVEILLAATGLKETPRMHDVSESLLDSAYLQREKLYLHLQSLIRGEESQKRLDRRNMMALESNHLFLAAGVVLCGTFCLCIEEEVTRNIAVRLMTLIDIKSSDIWDLANILLMLSIQE